MRWRDSRELIVPLASPFTRSLKPIIVQSVVLERLKLLLQANEVVEPCEFDRHVEGRGVVEELREVDGALEGGPEEVELVDAALGYH